MATRPINIDAIEKQTRTSWAEWLKFFDEIGARDLPHNEIAKKVSEKGVPGWWTQTITVAYEQHIGRRVPGQDSKGDFMVGVNKTIDGTMDETLHRWVHKTDGLTEFDGVTISRGPDTSTSDKWRYWHCGLSDGSRISVGIYQKTPEKAAIGIGHEKLKSEGQKERWRKFWKEFVHDL